MGPLPRVKNRTSASSGRPMWKKETGTHYVPYREGDVMRKAGGPPLPGGKILRLESLARAFAFTSGLRGSGQAVGVLGWGAWIALTLA